MEELCSIQNDSALALLSPVIFCIARLPKGATMQAVISGMMVDMIMESQDKQNEPVDFTPKSSFAQGELAVNWEAIPLARVCEALKHLGASLLDHHLDPRHIPMPRLWQPLTWNKQEVAHIFPGTTHFPFDQEEPPRTLGQRLRLVLHKSMVDLPTLSWQRLRLRLRSGNRVSNATWRPLITQILSGYLSPQARGRLMMRLLKQRFYGSNSYLLPTHLWRASAQIAFSSPTFQAHVCRKILKHMRTRVLLDPAQLPPIRFSPNTFWLLIALYRPEKPTFLQRIRPSWRKHLRLVETLANIAQQQARHSGWAAFWDQWLLLHALHRQPQDLYRLDPLFVRALPEMPLLAATTITWPQVKKIKSKSKSEPQQINLTQKDYHQQGPGIFYQLYESTMWEVAQGV